MKSDIYIGKLNKTLGKIESLEQSKSNYEALIEKYEKLLVATEQAQALIQTVAKETQETLVFQINDVVNTALNTCFPDEYEFKAEFEIKRNKTEAKLVFLKNGFEIDPLQASGGGVVDVASLGLRVAAWSLSNNDNVLLIDEGFKFLSRDLQPRMAEILQEISKKLNLQIIQVSHSPDLIENSDKIFVVKKVKEVSVVEA